MTVRIDGTNSTANPAITGADTDTGLQFGTNEVKVVTDGTDRVTVDSSGNVGIGVTSLASSSRLTLLESAGNGQTLEIKGANSGGSGSQPGIKFTASNGDNIGGFFADTNADELRIQTGGTDRILISNAGRMILTDNCTGIQFGDDDTGTNITSQTLDDYEEGTYSPTIRGWTGTYGVQNGVYTKIGRRVTINGQVRTNGGTGSFNYSFPMVSTPFAGTGVDPANDVAGTWSLTSGASSTLTSSSTIIGAGSWDGPGVGATEMFPNHYQVGNGLGNFSNSYIDSSANVEFRYYISYNI